ncbi:MAG: acriflavine resistance protein B [Bacteroidetes bacterium]|nr:MAG: acriflavine resistance protein B [Bacteroidota bacterium]
MKNYIVHYKNPITTCVAIVLMGGLFFYTRLKTSLFPEITFPKIKIIADAGLQPVDKMMVTVTKPLENAIKQVPDLVTIRSITSRGECEISAFMDWKSNIDLAKQRIESKIQQASSNLPPGVDIRVERMNPSILPIMGYSLESTRGRPAIDMWQLATYTVKPFLSQVQGVAEIRVTGGKRKEYWLTLDAQKMSTLGITPESLSNSLAQTNFIKSNGFLSDYHMLYLTVTDATVQTLDQLKKLIISNNGRRVIQLQDIATVSIEEAVEHIRINANGKEGTLIGVIKHPDANLIELSANLEKKIAELKKILPPDVQIKPFYIQADFVNDSIRSVTDSLWIGLLLAILVAIVFLRSWKASATILITIPVTISLTIIILYSIGYTLNIMTLGAIAASIGLIIDDAIVVMEQIQRTHEEHPLEPSQSLIQKAIRYLFPAMVGSSLSTIVIFIPFELMSGVAGAYFKVLTNTMIITLVSSFFVTWIGLPAIYLLFSGKRKSGREKKIKPHSVKQQRWVAFFIHKPWISFIIMAGFAFSIYWILPRLETGFLPEMDEGTIVLDYNSPPGTSLQETDRILQQVDKIVMTTPEVASYSRRTGAEMGFFVTEPNKGDYLIQLKKERNKTTEEVISDLRKQIESSQPALRIDMGQVIADMLGDLMTSVQPVAIKIFGNDQHRLEELSKQVADSVREVKGTADVFDGIVIAGPSVSVVPDNNKLLEFGITPSSLQFQMQTRLEGNIVGNILEREQLSPVRIVYPNSRYASVADLYKTLIFLPTGKFRPVNELASVSVNQGTAENKRENLQSMGEVSARLEGRDLGGVMKDIQNKLEKQVTLPQGYHIEYGGAYAEQQQSFSELLTILITSSLLVFAVILFLFRDFKIALMIILLAILGIAGSYAALYLTNTPLNVGSYTGLIMIVGIIGENAIFTILQFRESLKEKNVDDSIIFALSTRIRPKLMTAFGAIIALMPLALGIGTGAQLHQPLAIAVIGGFIAALPLLLIVLPSLLRLLVKNKTDIPQVV